MGKVSPWKTGADRKTGSGCILYVRYSPRRVVNVNADGEAESMHGQIEKCRRFAVERGWEVLAVRKDEEKTGRGNGQNRSGLMQAIEECKRAGAVLVIAKLDRLSRDVEFIAALLKSEVDFVAVDNPHATKLTIHIMAAMAEYESDQISERTRAAMLAMQRNGRAVSKEMPFGWQRGESFVSKKLNGTQVIAWTMKRCEQEQAALARLRELSASGLRVASVARALNEEGVPARGGTKWQSNKINRILKRDQDAGGVFDP